MTERPPKHIGIAILGHGTVGTGVVRILSEQHELLRKRTGIRFEIRHVVVRDLDKHKMDRAILPLSTDARAAIDDPSVSIVIELMGGTTTALDCIQHALTLGKPVVTANKSLLAEKGTELFSLARKHNTCIAFEASCGGGIPIVDALTRGLLANRIDALVGIVNGTCNVILTRMTQNGWTYRQALDEAQRNGFAETDPTMDVSGRDAAQKLAILASLAFNAQVRERDVYVEGIGRVDPIDIGFARDLGYVLKLLAIAQRTDGHVSLRVHPTLVHHGDVLADVCGSFNAISVYGHAVGHTLFYGRGAGQLPTASAVVADLMNVAMGVTKVAFDSLGIFPDSTAPIEALPIEQLETRYYLRLMARDVPGVLAEIADALGRNGISLSAVLQREPSERGHHVPVVITTHKAREGSMQAAIRAIDKLSTILPETVCYRIIDPPREFEGKG